MTIAEQFKIELMNYVQDRLQDGCNPNIAYMHAASQARGAARVLKLLGDEGWVEFEAMADGFWELCFPDKYHHNLKA